MKKTTTFFSLVLTCLLQAQTTAIPDPIFEQKLIDLGYDTVLDGTVLTGNIDNVTNLFLYYAGINDLTGIQDFTALTKLNCSHNNLTSLNVSQNINLEELYCLENQISSLDLSQNTLLKAIDCSDNSITSLDFTHQNMLSIRCISNNLSCLNIKNGHTNSLSTSSFNATNNPNLYCIEVDNPTWAIANLTSVDSQINFSTNCTNACSVVGLEELEKTALSLIRIVDFMGRETKFTPNTPLIYIYSDGSRERIFKIE